MSDCRESIGEITSFYSGFDNQFFREYARAANERLTDATTVFRKIARNNSASADLDWAGEAKFDYDSALEALTYEANSLKIISGTVNVTHPITAMSFSTSAPRALVLLTLESNTVASLVVITRMVAMPA